MTEAVRGAEQLVFPAVQWLRLALEVVGACWIAVGFLSATGALVTSHLRGLTGSFTAIRLQFSRYLSLALEFQLASDILSTALVPAWDELGKMAATAIIRTALNYFLSLEIKEYRDRPPASQAE